MLSRYPTFNATSNYVCNSYNEPIAIVRNLLNSESEFLPKPSAILLGIDTLHRRSCDVRPNVSSFGNSFVAEYKDVTSNMLFCQIINSLNVPMV